MGALFNLTLDGERRRYVARPAGSGSASSLANYTQQNTNYPKPSRLSILSKSVPSRPLATQQKREAVIDVVNGFDWTTTPINNAGFSIKPPSITLTEHKLTTSTLVYKLLYTILAGRDSVSDMGEALASVVNKIQALENFEDVASNISSAFNSLIGREGDGSDPMEPYNLLYPTEPTSFVYKLPYFDDTFRNVSNAWADTYSGDGKHNFLNYVESVIDAGQQFMVGAQGIFRPGVYIEKSQFYQFSSQGENFSFTFPLLNTLNPESVSKNYQLLTLLIFQNRPYRRSRVLIDPSHLYEINIPGTRYVKWGVINELSVNFLGTRREMSIDVPNPGGGLKQINCIVPEAYVVNITMTSLTNESGNFIIEMLNKGS